MWLFEQSTPANICVGCNVNGPVSAEALQQAVDWCQVRYPVLRTLIIFKKKRLYFGCFKSREAPKIRIDIGQGEPESEDRIVEQVLGERIDGTKELMFRVKLVRLGNKESFLCVYFNHLIGDGSSGVMVMRDLLKALGQLSSGGPVSEPLALAFPPCVEEVVPPEHRGFQGFKKFIKFQKSFSGRLKKLGGQPSHIRTQESVPYVDRKTKILSLSFSRKQTAALLQRSKEEGVTLYTLLAASALDAAYPMLKPDSRLQDSSSRIVSFASPADLRPYLLCSVKDQFCLYSSSLNHLYRLEKNNDLVSLAKSFQKDLKRSLIRDKHQLHLTPYVAKFLSFRWLFPKNSRGVERAARITDKMFKTCAMSLTYISNPQVAPQIGDLSISRARGHIAPSIMGVALYSAVLHNQSLSIYLNYNARQFSDDDAELMNSRLKENIQFFSGNMLSQIGTNPR